LLELKKFHLEEPEFPQLEERLVERGKIPHPAKMLFADPAPGQGNKD
jgi:hypothetical protein